MGSVQQFEMSAQLSLKVFACDSEQVFEASVDLPYGTFCTVEKINQSIHKVLEQLKEKFGEDVRLLTNKKLGNHLFQERTGIAGNFYLPEEYAEPFQGIYNSDTCKEEDE
ncbi:hypothetical protein AAEX28_07300 [Lentisphaerota bacterium WC36G]|nr:hypothetical protein LJT99_10160 [Lentisphaerae bacterium WC36]